VALALALELINPAIRTAAQLQRELGVQPVIIVPNLSDPRDRWRRWFWWLGVFGALGATAAALLQDRLFRVLAVRRMPVRLAAGPRRQ
jgi:tyrosine-protein kinase Etk/Wzc